jgi:hypothetical protein
VDTSDSHRKDWTKTPFTDSRAKPIDWLLAPTGRSVVRVREATIRNATIRNECFLLVEDYKIQQRSNGTERLEVECYWFGKRPKTTWMNITVQPGEYEIRASDGTDIVVDIGK